MRYMGSKTRLSSHIIPIMERYRDGRVWVEPFVGGGNMIDKVNGARVGLDLNKDAIDGLKTIRDALHTIPKTTSEFSEIEYVNRCSDKPHLRGYVSFALSFGGKHWGGWSRDRQNTDYVARGYRAAQKQSPLLQGVVLICGSYDTIKISQSCLIYCDPPYAGTTKYKTGGFDHEVFWSWCQDMADMGHTVFVSEYNAPDFAVIMWEKPLSSSIRRKDDRKTTEKLYMVPSRYLQKAIREGRKNA